jgi:hypothetical protein
MVTGHVMECMAVKYIMVIKNGQFIAVLEQAWQVQQFLCANHTKIPYFDIEIKYLDFVSCRLASAETQ